MIVHELSPSGRHWSCAGGAPSVLLRDEAERDYFARSGGSPEAPLISWAAQFLTGGAFYDIGAHVGTWSLTLAPRCFEVHAFEPQRSTFYRLCGGIALSGLENVTAHNVALSDRRTEDGRLHLISEDGGGSSLTYREERGAHRSVEVVRVAKLDDFKLWERHRPVELIKIDVEGLELAVLQGASFALSGAAMPKPTILLECWQQAWFAEERAELLRYVKSALRYRVTPITGWGEMLLLEPEASSGFRQIDRA